jgi:pimeloyl-ACP methyl ester carboxylesterase
LGIPLLALAWLFGPRVLHLPFSRHLATYALSATPEGVSERQLSVIIDDVAHCPAYLQLLVKAVLMPGLQELAETAVPASLVVCEKDRVVPSPRFSRHFTKHLPEGHRVVTLDNVGHVPMLEAPERVTEVILDFLDECVPSNRAAEPPAS